LINQHAGTPAGFFLPALYKNAGLTRDITSGNNQPADSPIGYKAGKGWDACTGLGVPDGNSLINALAASLKTTEPAA